MKKLSIICMTVLAISFLASCRGPQVPAGHDGNANVASSTVTIHDYDWKWNNFYTDGEGNERGQFYVGIDYAAINSNVFNHGAVLVYMDIEGAWSQVPLTYYYEDDGGLFEASIEVATLNDGGLNIFWTESDLWKVRPGTHDFKIVAIQANVYKDRGDVDYSNYEAVKKAFQLAD
jgi:hypothetical protein